MAFKFKWYRRGSVGTKSGMAGTVGALLAHVERWVAEEAEVRL